jgi:hypothetical protein
MQHGMNQATSGPPRSLLDEADRVLRELAVQQGLAYASYGEALQRVGENKAGWSDLLKTSSDIYIKEVAQTLWSLIRADINIYAWMLSMAGARPLGPDAAPKQNDKPAGARPQRGRR